jgi:nucleoside-diphosphate-sugar epimerase
MPGLVARALALPKRGGQLTIGNGDTVRDFLHVADVVNAYLSLAETGTSGEVYNVCSGDGVSIRTLAESVLQRIGVPADISIDPALTRPVDVPVQIGSNAKLRRATGWTPRRTREDIIDDLINASTR